MKTEWNYDNLAEAYLKRPEYANEALDQIISAAQLSKHAKVCDVGAGVAHLTIPLALRGYKVNAVEPNYNMRKFGSERTKDLSNVSWFEAVGEDTKQPDSYFDLVSFGSSFNVVNRKMALKEAKRILKPKGWFVAMWNHRDLNDSIQKQIEQIIMDQIPEYNYGSRREDQSEIIIASNLFCKLKKIEANITHMQSIEEVVEAWNSHATLQRQAKDKFSQIINRIEEFLRSTSDAGDQISIPYTTRAWVAQLK